MQQATWLLLAGQLQPILATAAEFYLLSLHISANIGKTYRNWIFRRFVLHSFKYRIRYQMAAGVNDFKVQWKSNTSIDIL